MKWRRRLFSMASAVSLVLCVATIRCWLLEAIQPYFDFRIEFERPYELGRTRWYASSPWNNSQWTKHAPGRLLGCHLRSVDAGDRPRLCHARIRGVGEASSPALASRHRT